MTAVLKTAWRIVARRAVAHRAVLAAAFITVLLATALMAAGPIYSDAVTLSSLRRSLQDASLLDANVALSTRIDPSTYGSDDALVFQAVTDAFSATGGEVHRRGTADSFSAIDLPGERSTEILLFRFFSDIESRVQIVAGAWPERGSQVVEVAIPEAVAASLGLEPGAAFRVENRRSPDETWPVEVTGVYRLVDPTDPYWLDDELDTTGRVESANFTTHGPFVVDRETYFETVGSTTSSIRWAVFPDHGSLELADVGLLANRVNRLEGGLNAGRAVSNQIQVDTGLVSLLRSTERSLLVTRSAVLVVFIQLALLAGYALLLTAGLLSDSREIETTTLRSRGAGSGQILGMATMEGFLVVAPALLAAPFIAAAVLSGFNVAGPLAGIGLRISPQVTSASWALAALAAAACLVAMVAPALASARRFGSVRAARSRQSARSMAQSAGADLVLLAVAALGMWQLARYGSTITSTLRGRLGVDPLLVGAPALALLAGAVISLRALPLLARSMEAVVARTRRLLPGLGIWYVGRQPRRYARSALLLTLAVAIGFFALAYHSTWTTSQTDQAGFQVGADIRAVPAQRAGSIPVAHLGDAHARIPGIEQSVPVVESTGRIPGAELPVRYLAIDSARAPDVLHFRADLAGRPLSDLMSELSSPRPELPGVALEGRPTEISAVLAATITVPPEEVEQCSPAPRFDGSLRVVVVDGAGQLNRLDLGAMDPSGSPVSLTGHLGFTASTGETFDPVYPLRIHSVELRSLAPVGRCPLEGVVAVTALRYFDGGTWKQIVIEPGSAGFDTAMSELRQPFETPSMSVAAVEEGFVVHLETGVTSLNNRQPVVFAVNAAAQVPIGPVPVLVSTALMEELHLSEGSVIPLPGLSQFDGTGVVAGHFDLFPTVEPERTHAVVLDYQTYLAAVHGPGVVPTRPTAYWLSADEEAVTDAARMLAAPPLSSTEVVSTPDRATSLALDPAALGTLGALIMGLLAAVVLAAIGFVVNMTISTRERLGQFALFRAVGLSTRQLLAWLTIENGVVIVFGLVAGLGLGLLLTTVVLPLVTVTQQAGAVVPDLIVVHPWSAVGVLIAVLLVGLAVGLVFVSGMIRRLDTASLIRLGDE